MQFYLNAFLNYFNFKSRTSRREYWMFIIFNFIFMTGAAILNYIVERYFFKDTIYGYEGFVSGLYLILMIIPLISATVRRLHDSDKSGWWVLILMIPALGPFILLVLLVLASDPGENKYGI